MINHGILGFIFLRPNKLMVLNRSDLATAFVWTWDSVVAVSNRQVVFEAQNKWGVWEASKGIYICVPIHHLISLIIWRYSPTMIWDKYPICGEDIWWKCNATGCRWSRVVTWLLYLLVSGTTHEYRYVHMFHSKMYITLHNVDLRLNITCCRGYIKNINRQT